MPHRFVTAGYIGLVLAGGWAVNNASEQRSEQKLRTLERSCEQAGNPARALDRLVSTGYIRVLRQDLQPIVDCHRTFFDEGGQPVPLGASQQALYVEYVRRGVVPVIREDGTVVPPK